MKKKRLKHRKDIYTYRENVEGEEDRTNSRTIRRGRPITSNFVWRYSRLEKSQECRIKLRMTHTPMFSRHRKARPSAKWFAITRCALLNEGRVYILKYGAYDVPNTAQNWTVCILRVICTYIITDYWKRVKKISQIVKVLCLRWDPVGEMRIPKCFS